MKMILFAIAAACLIDPAIEARAQSFSIDSFTIGSGGGTASGGAYSLSATIGKSDAGTSMNGASYALDGGFWSITVMPVQDAPMLKVVLTATNTAVISWPSPSAGFLLQQNSDLSVWNWTTVTGTVADDGTNRYFIVNPPPVGNRFYRLVHP